MSWMRGRPVVTEPLVKSCQVCTQPVVQVFGLTCSRCRDSLDDIARRLAYHTNMTYDQAVRALTVTLADMPKRVEER